MLFSEQIEKFLPTSILLENYDADDIASKYYINFWCKYCKIHFLKLKKGKNVDCSPAGRDFLACPATANTSCIVCHESLETEYYNDNDDDNDDNDDNDNDE